LGRIRIRILLSLSILFAFLFACANDEVESFRTGQSTDSSREATQALSSLNERYVAYLPMESTTCGVLFIWDTGMSPIRRVSEAPPLQGFGKDRTLQLVPVYIYNFLDRPEKVPSLADGNLSVRIKGEAIIAYPLSHYASRFRHGETLRILEANMPDEVLPARNWTKAYLACEVGGGSLSDLIPEKLEAGGGGSVPWKPVDSQKLDHFLRNPSVKGLTALLEPGGAEEKQE
jgi:hypothetical protein